MFPSRPLRPASQQAHKWATPSARIIQCNEARVRAVKMGNVSTLVTVAAQPKMHYAFCLSNTHPGFESREYLSLLFLYCIPF
jgi:hypothetical protein